MNMPDLEIYSSLSEGQLLHYYEPDRGIFVAESPKVITRALQAGYEPLSFLLEKRQLEESRGILRNCGEVPVYLADTEIIAGLTGFHLTRGILCAMRRKVLPAPEELCENARRVVVLENVNNPTNIGAIFRSAAALNADAILLSPGCSDPLYRRSARVSMGTVFQIPWTYFGRDEHCSWPEGGMRFLREQGFKTVAMALREDSSKLDDPVLRQEKKLAIIMGAEGDGLSEKTIDAADYTVCIPMTHGVDSLNVAAASAVAFWQLCRPDHI